MIRYGISKEYLPDWGPQEALREIYQNFTDFGDYNESIEDPHHGGSNLLRVTLSNGYSPEGLEFLRIGDSGKRLDKTKIGKHGEGLKMAFFVLTREGMEAVVHCGGEIFTGIFYDDEFLGEVFGLGVKQPGTALRDFTVQFTVTKEEFERYRIIQLDPDEIIHTTPYGSLIKRDPGTVLVGGQFVSVVKGLKYAYDFSPKHIELDRDRRVPRDFDVDWCASQILASWSGLKVADMTSRDALYMPKVPDNVAKKFKPSIVNKKVIFRAKEIQAPPSIAEHLMRMPVNQKRVQKLKYTTTRKRVPSSLLKEFFDKHQRSFSTGMKIDFRNLMLKSKSWNQKEK